MCFLHLHPLPAHLYITCLYIISLHTPSTSPHPHHHIHITTSTPTSRSTTSPPISPTQRGKVPIVVGGTGFYLRWFVFGKPATPQCTPELAAQADALLQEVVVVVVCVCVYVCVYVCVCVCVCVCVFACDADAILQEVVLWCIVCACLVCIRTYIALHHMEWYVVLTSVCTRQQDHDLYTPHSHVQSPSHTSTCPLMLHT